MTDGSGNNPVSYSYDVFGTIRSQTGTSANQWLFTGEQRDSDSSLYSLRARYYDPSIGRFLGRDPLSGSSRRPDTLNRYVYVRNNPANLVDPYGLFGFSDITDTVSDAADVVTDVVDYTEHAAVNIGSTAGSATAAAGDFLSNPRNLAGTAQLVSGAVITLTCGPQVLIPVAGEVAAGACAGAYAVYLVAWSAKMYLADCTSEVTADVISGGIGLVPATGFYGYALAAFSGGVDALGGCATTAYASNPSSDPKE